MCKCVPKNTFENLFQLHIYKTRTGGEMNIYYFQEFLRRLYFIPP